MSSNLKCLIEICVPDEGASSFLLSVLGPPSDIGGRPTVRAQPEREAITQLLCIPGQDFTLTQI